MSTLKARRDPVNQAASAFLLVAVLAAAGILLKLASPVHGHPIGAFEVIAMTTMAVIGLLVLRGSLIALVVGTTLVAEACLGTIAAAGRVHPAAVVVVVAFHGVLLFFMVRGIVALSRKR